MNPADLDRLEADLHRMASTGHVGSMIEWDGFSNRVLAAIAHIRTLEGALKSVAEQARRSAWTAPLSNEPFRAPARLAVFLNPFCKLRSNRYGQGR